MLYRSIAGIAILPMLWAAQASASLITYEYIGNPYDYIETDVRFYLGDEEARNFFLESQPAHMTASFTIDKSLLSGQSLSNIDYSLTPCFDETTVLCPDDAVSSIHMHDGVGSSLSATTDSGPVANLTLNFSTDLQGNITSWNLALLDDGPELKSSSEAVFGQFSKGDASDPFRTGGFGPCAGQLCATQPGEWARVPEPTMLLLLGVGVAGLVFARPVRKMTVHA